MDESLYNELLALEHRGWQSLCDGDGAQFYGDLMTADAVMILAHGFAFDRSAVIESFADAPPWDSYEIADPTVISLGDDQAILRYTGTGRRGTDDDFVALMGSVYVRVAGTWRLAHYQQTPIPGTG